MRTAGRSLLVFAALLALFGGGARRGWAGVQEDHSSRALATLLFSDFTILETGWVRPWEVPVSIPWLSVQGEGVSTGEAYWKSVDTRLSEIFDSSAPAVSRINRLRALCRPPVAAISESLRELAARLHSAAVALSRAPGRTTEEKALAVAGNDIGAPAESAAPSEAEAASECRTLAASIGGYTQMTYLHAANWNAAAMANNAAELAASLDLLTVRVRYMNSPDAINEAVPTQADAERLQATLQGLLDDVVAAAQDQRAVLGDPTSVPPLMAFVRPLEMGDGSYVVQCFASEPSPGFPLPNITSAWMRRGNLITEVDLNGSLSPAAEETLVRAVLSAVDRSILKAGPDSIKKAFGGNITLSGQDEAHPVSPESPENPSRPLGEATGNKEGADNTVAMTPPGKTVEQQKEAGEEGGQVETISALGLQVEFRDGAPWVAAVEPGSWAAKTSIKPEWVIFRVNEEPVAGLTLEKIRELLLRPGHPFVVIDFIIPSGEVQRMLLPLRQ